MNRESYKFDRIRSNKLYNLRRNKLQVESTVDRNKDINSNDTGGNTSRAKIRERLRVVRRQKNNNRRKLRKHKERKEMDRKKRRKERINNRLKELKHILEEVTLNENETEATEKTSNVIIKDLTNWLFTESDLSLCAKGQKFIPKPLRIDLVKKYSDFTSFCRKLRLALYHSRRRREITAEGSESQGGPERILGTARIILKISVGIQVHPKANLIPGLGTILFWKSSLQQLGGGGGGDTFNPANKRKVKDNLTKEERQSLQKLRNWNRKEENARIIRVEEKGSSFVVDFKSHYLQENLEMLDFEEGNNNSYNQGQIKDKTFRCEPEDSSRAHAQRV